MLSGVGPEKVKRQSRKIILLLLFNLGSCSNVLFQADLDSISPPVLVQHLTQPGSNSTNRAMRLSQNQRRRNFDKHLPEINSVHKASCCFKDVENSPLPYRKEPERQSFCDAKGSLFPYQNVPQERGKGYLLLFSCLNDYLTELLSPNGRIIDFEDSNKGGKAEFSSSFYH